MVDAHRVGTIVSIPETNKALVLVDEKLVENNTSLIGRLVGVKQGNMLIIGVITDSKAYNELNEPDKMKRLKELLDQRIVSEQEIHLVYVEFVTAIKEETPIERTPLNFLIKPSQEVFLLENHNTIKELNQRFDSIGYFIGENIKQPLHIKDFKEEAYHTLIVGKTGSGKSSLAMMLMSLYAKNSDMSFVIIDPVGEFARAFEGREGTFPIRKVWQNLNRSVTIIKPGISHKLDHKEIFIGFCKYFNLFEPIGITNQKIREASEKLLKLLEIETFSELPLLTFEEFVEKTTKKRNNTYELAEIYSASNKAKRDEITEKLETQESLEEFYKKYKTIQRFFANKPGIIEEIQKLSTENRLTFCIDLSEIEWLNPAYANEIKALIVERICRELYKLGKTAYNQGRSLNTLAILDEAHRFVPAKGLSEDTEEQDKTTKAIKTSIIETRKFGLGWLIISTRASNLDRRIFEETRNKFIGFGLHTGSDADLLREYFKGKDILTRYANMQDPEDVLSKNKKVQFMVHGPITVLSREHPEFIQVFSFEEFLKHNSLDETKIAKEWDFF
ncbi:MAG: ATP-binding protein [Candidatus Aenigmatarchaeota archaeon]